MESLEKQIKGWSRAIKLNPKNSDLYRSRAKLYELLDENDLAKLDYDAAYALDIKYWDQQVRDDPEDSSAYQDRGDVHEKHGEHLLAIKDYTKAIELIPDSYVRNMNQKAYTMGWDQFYLEQELDCLHSRGKAYCAVGEYCAAIQDFNHVISKIAGMPKYFSTSPGQQRINDATVEIQHTMQAFKNYLLQLENMKQLTDVLQQAFQEVKQDLMSRME